MFKSAEVIKMNKIYYFRNCKNYLTINSVFPFLKSPMSFRTNDVGYIKLLQVPKRFYEFLNYFTKIQGAR